MVTFNQFKFFELEGYLLVENILSVKEMTFYDQTYNGFINNEFDYSCY